MSVPSGLRVWPSARGGRAGTKAQSTRWQAIQHGGSPSSSGVAIALRRCPERRSTLRTLIPRHPEVCPSQPIIVAAPSHRRDAPHPHHRPLLHPQRRQRGHLRLDKNKDKGRGARALHVGRCVARTMLPPIVSPEISYCGGNFRGAELLALRFRPGYALRRLLGLFLAGLRLRSVSRSRVRRTSSLSLLTPPSALRCGGGVQGRRRSFRAVLGCR